MKVESLRPEQIQPARELLEWSRERLAEASGVTVPTLLLAESGRTKPRVSTLAAIGVALETGGVEFTHGDAPGVRLRNVLP